MKLDEEIKDAICNNNIIFFENNLKHFSINYRLEDEDNDTMLLYSISDPSSDLYNFFLDKNADITLCNNEGEGILHAIVFSGDNSRLNKILKNYKLDINHRTKEGVTALLLAISLEKIDVAENLIKNGANVNISDAQGITPLHLAAQLPDDNVNFVKYLLSNGADPFLKTDNGNLALALAVNSNNKNIIELLYKNMYQSPAGASVPLVSKE